MPVFWYWYQGNASLENETNFLEEFCVELVFFFFLNVWQAVTFNMTFIKYCGRKETIRMEKERIKLETSFPIQVLFLSPKFWPCSCIAETSPPSINRSVCSSLWSSGSLKPLWMKKRKDTFISLEKLQEFFLIYIMPKNWLIGYTHPRNTTQQ